jgi:2-polyprenyl-6-methoxyphenol hydroxylase-like FAD-dependent oxidoreductase
VVDCTGRRSVLDRWLAGIGAAAPVQASDESGLVYYGRHFRSATGEQPALLTTLLQHHDSLSVVTLPADAGTWSVGFIVWSGDRALRALREPDRWQAVLARYPTLAHWGSPAHGAEPITGVEVMGGLRDRSLRLVVDDDPVATGVLALGDSWSFTNPAFGRGLSIGLVHARALQSTLREVEPTDAEKLSRRFAEVTAATVEPLFQATRSLDRHRLGELIGDATGTPYCSADPSWALSHAVAAAATVDPDALRTYSTLAALNAPPAEVFGAPGVVDRILGLARTMPRYTDPGPDRTELLRTVTG